MSKSPPARAASSAPATRRRRAEQLLTVLWGVCILSALCVRATELDASSATSSETAPQFEPLETPVPIKGMTIGPIESALHPGVGYGSVASAEAMALVRRLGGNWVSLTPFGRVWDLGPSGVDRRFEAPFEENRSAIERAIDQAHAAGLQVMLVPHLWVETGGWRGELDFEREEDWQRFAESYRQFVLTWARVAQKKRVSLFSVGVELRSWVTTTRAPSFTALIDDVRKVYDGRLTYAANWDDADHSVIWGQLDVIGVNAFFPLAQAEGAKLSELLSGGKQVADRLAELAARWHKPILLTEIGYTNRKDPALRPWEWPEALGDVTLDPSAQADAYQALLTAFIERPWFAGFFVWRMYSDPFDVSQEPAWGFSPLFRPAELVLRDALSTRWYGELRGAREPALAAWARPRAIRIGDY